MIINDTRVKEMIDNLVEIRDNTPAIYEDECLMYYKLLTRAIMILRHEYPNEIKKCLKCPENNKMCMYHEKE